MYSRFSNIILCFLFTCLVKLCPAQISEADADLRKPLKLPFVFSGNFAELRATHFHSGVDLKTNGRTGYRVYAADGGYVERILVSPTGYGNALYVRHPNGLMTVYAHLRNFVPRIEKYVTKMQYAKESWALDIHVEDNKLKVNKGEVIAYSGNTGSSGGPHLHFEVRDFETQEPLNPMFYYKSTDNIRPQIKALYIYRTEEGKDVFTLSAQEVKVYRRGGKFYPKHSVLTVPEGKIGFGLSVKEYITGSWNVCGIYSMRMSVDGRELFHYETDRFAFNETRYVNLLKDYKRYIDKRQNIYKSWLPDGTDFSFLKSLKDGGITDVKKDSVYSVKFEIDDVAGNRSVLSFRVKGTEAAVSKNEKYAEVKGNRKMLKAGERNILRLDDITLCVNKGALFADAELYIHKDTLAGDGGEITEVYDLGGEYLPLNKRVKISLCGEGRNLDKGYFENSVRGGRFFPVRTIVKNDSAHCSVRNLGRFVFKTDTVAPRILPRRNYRLKKVSNHCLYFTAEEKESGIADYSARINGKWVLTKYNPRRNMITVDFTNFDKLPKGKYKLEVRVKDNCDNEALYAVSVYL